MSSLNLYLFCWCIERYISIFKVNIIVNILFATITDASHIHILYVGIISPLIKIEVHCTIQVCYCVILNYIPRVPCSCHHQSHWGRTPWCIEYMRLTIRISTMTSHLKRKLVKSTQTESGDWLCAPHLTFYSKKKIPTYPIFKFHLPFLHF